MSDLSIEKISPTPLRNNRSIGKKDAVEFNRILKGAVSSVDRLEKDADRNIVDLLQGKADIHETMIAIQKADISMRLLLTVRNKVLEAYREIMRMHF